MSTMSIFHYHCAIRFYEYSMDVVQLTQHVCFEHPYMRGLYILLLNSGHYPGFPISKLSHFQVYTCSHNAIEYDYIRYNKHTIYKYTLNQTIHTIIPQKNKPLIVFSPKDIYPCTKHNVQVQQMYQTKWKDTTVRLSK